MSAGLAWIACKEPPAYRSRITLLTKRRYNVYGGLPSLLTLFADFDYTLRKLCGKSDRYDITPPGRIAEINETLEWAMNLVNPFCLMQSRGPCEGPTVDGHTIQEARLHAFRCNITGGTVMRR